MNDLAEAFGDDDDFPAASDGIPADDPPMTDQERYDAAAPGEAFPVSDPRNVTPAPASEAERGFDFNRESYAWAQDVFFVYDHLGATAKVAKAWAPARRELLKHAKADMNNFMGQLVPKAMQLYEKARDKSGDLESVQIAERKGITELRQILKAAIVEAQGVTA